jgi:site-specific DNA-methyltransferase (adenine-specific)
MSVMAGLASNSIDAVATDPPYGLGHAGHEWSQPGFDGARDGEPASGRFGRSDAVVAGRYDRTITGQRRFQEWCETWATQALRVLRPGGHLLAFSSPQSYHRLAAGVEDAGFEVRGQIAWLFSEGFPKALNVAKAFDRAAGVDVDDAGWEPQTAEAARWAGWHTALKPAHEPIVIARKPLAARNVPANLRAHGVGALNIDGARIPLVGGERLHDFARTHDGCTFVPHPAGRFPADVILSPAAAEQLDTATGVLVSGANPTRRTSAKSTGRVYGRFDGQQACAPVRGRDVGGGSRFYYCARAAPGERDAGCEEWGGNPHPTPKPIALMSYLIGLVTPPGGTVLDMFAGSGSTGIAAILGGFVFIGGEREPMPQMPRRPYVEVARARLRYWQHHPEGPVYPPSTAPPAAQATLFAASDL